MTTVAVEVRGVVFEVDVTYSPYVPAKITGPPEDCHPEEGGELEDMYFEAAYIMEWDVLLPNDFGEKLYKQYLDEIEEEVRQGNTL